MTIRVTSDPDSPPPNVWVMGRELRQAEAIEDGARAAFGAAYVGYPQTWDTITELGRQSWRGTARAVLAAAPPAPTVSDTAAVLAGLRDAMVGRANHADCTNSEGDVWGSAIALVQAAQEKAATGARAAGGESLGETDPPLVELLNEAGNRWGPLGVALAAARLTDEPAPAVSDTAAVLAGLVQEMRALAVEHEKEGRRAVALGLRQAGRVVEATQATPGAQGVGGARAAGGVAELLADVRRQAEAGWSTARFTCDEIVRLLAPSGADGETPDA